MTEIYYLKRIDNSRLIRGSDPVRTRECRALLGGALLVLLLLLVHTWQHFEYIRYGYRLEELKAQHEQAAEWNRQLRLEQASLKDPMRIDAIARAHLGMAVPAPGQIVRLEGGSAEPAASVLARLPEPALAGTATANGIHHTD